MATTTPTATRGGSRTTGFDALEDAVGSRVADFAARIGRRVGRHAVHVLAFVTLVLCRQDTVLALADALERAFGHGLAGIPAMLVHTWATGYDGFWSAVLAMLPAAGAR